jgi:hypothetical protein
MTRQIRWWMNPPKARTIVGRELDSGARCGRRWRLRALLEERRLAPGALWVLLRRNPGVGRLTGSAVIPGGCKRAARVSSTAICPQA